MNTQDAADRLQKGELVVFPTETVYGIGALASNDDAVQKIFEVKGRPQENPLILHIADRSQLDELVKEIPGGAVKLMDAFWPGPLTICFQKSDQVSDLVTAGLSSVCLRNPDHPLTHDLLSRVGSAVAAPSANISGRPSTTTFGHATAQLKEKGVHIIDGGNTVLGLESTVVDCTRTDIRILRPGVVSKDQLEKCLGFEVNEEHIEKITSPGQLLEHYAPQGKLHVIIGDATQRREWISKHATSQATLGVVGTHLEGQSISPYQVLCEKEDNLKIYAQNLYQFLNWCDETNATDIILELPALREHQLYSALLNRLNKASQGNILNLDQ
ncbi:MAG: L-threonylcarbamoyladenylate synthase [Candidatus Gracilibacteria bacterium]|nr:L-threonylcarbamoyladenylate synthase [Candidatus Gracilibacteria bacterium]